MLTKLLNIPRHYAQLITLKLILILLILTTLGIATLFMAAVMVIAWHWHMETAFLVCLLPWILLSLTLLIIVCAFAKRLKQEKEALMVFKIASLVWMYLLKVRS